MVDQSRKPKHVLLTLAAVVPITLAVVILAMVLTRSDREDPVARIEFVVPNGFRGAFVVRKASPVTSYRGADRRVIIEINEEGVASVEELRLFDRFSATARFADGTIISAGDVTDGVAFRDLFTLDDNSIWFLIGTKSEAIEAWSSPPPRLGGIGQ